MIPTGRATRARPASSRPQTSTANRFAPSKVMRRTASLRPCRRLSLTISPSSAATARRASSTRAKSLLERLARTPVARADLEKTIAEALDGHLCRCTGYVKYHQAVRDVILADPERYLRSSWSRTCGLTCGHGSCVATVALPANVLTAYAISDESRRTVSPAPRALPRSTIRPRGRRLCSPNSARC